MSRIVEIATAFADLNLQIIQGIQKRGYSHADRETLATVRENLETLKALGVNIDGVTDSAETSASE